MSRWKLAALLGSAITVVVAYAVLGMPGMDHGTSSGSQASDPPTDELAELTPQQFDHDSLAPDAVVFNVHAPLPHSGRGCRRDGVAPTAAPHTPALRHRKMGSRNSRSRSGDRRLVARAIARAALAGQPAGTALAFIATGVVARVEALLDDRRPAPWLGASFATLLGSLLATSAAGSGVQLHHLVALLDHICR